MLTGYQSFGQQDPQFSQYMFNSLFYNPAYAGIPGATHFTVIHRTQWLGYDTSVDPAGNPNTQVISANMPIFKINSGVGFHIVNDALGVQNNMQLQGSAAYHLPMKKAKLSIGLRVGVFSQTLDYNKLRWIDPDDPLNQKGKESQIRPDLAAGLLYRAERFYVGVSANHLIQSEFDYGNDSLRNALEPHLYITGGYDYELNYDITLRPSVLIKTDLKTYSFEVSLVASLRDKIHGGISYRQSDMLGVLVGYSFAKDDSFRLGYAVDFTLATRDAKELTSHELMLSYTLPVLSGGEKRIIRTPRFRH